MVSDSAGRTLARPPCENTSVGVVYTGVWTVLSHVARAKRVLDNAAHVGRFVTACLERGIVGNYLGSAPCGITRTLHDEVAHHIQSAEETLAAARMERVQMEALVAEAHEEAHLQDQFDDEQEALVAPEAERAPAHPRIVRLAPDAPRLLRHRPQVEARTWDGKPLVPAIVTKRNGAIDAAKVDEHRAMKRMKADGRQPLPLRAAAVAGDDKRRQLTNVAPTTAPGSESHAFGRSLPHASGNLENNVPQHALHEALMANLNHRVVRPNEKGNPVQRIVVRSEAHRRLDDGEPLADVLYVRTSLIDADGGISTAVRDAIRGTVARALDRGGADGNDNADVASDPSGGAYVNHGATVLWQETFSRSVKALVEACSARFHERLTQLKAMLTPMRAAAAAAAAEAEREGLSPYEHQRLRQIDLNTLMLKALGLDVSSAKVYKLRYGAPYRHKNGASAAVQGLCEANALVAGAAAQLVQTHMHDVYRAMWEPVLATPVIGPVTVYPTPEQQVAGGREWDVQDRLPRDGDLASLPLGHLASRTAGLPPPDGQDAGGGDGGVMAKLRSLMAKGVSNLHIDRADSRRRRGVPIVYWPYISASAWRHPKFDPQHPMPSSDIVIAENGCSAAEGGGRVFRVVTCIPGWVCIVAAHYDACLHGGVYPNGPDGGIVDPTSMRPYLEDVLTPGVELLRLVLYQMARVDDFNFAVQAEYDARGGPPGAGETDEQRKLLREVYACLAPPLDERFRMLHPWLEPKEDDAQSAPFGARGRWERSRSLDRSV